MAYSFCMCFILGTGVQPSPQHFMGLQSPNPWEFADSSSRPEHKACCSLPVELILHFDVERNLALPAPRNTWPSLHEFLVSFPVEKEGSGLDLWTFLWLLLLVAFMTAAFQHLLVFVCH